MIRNKIPRKKKKKTKQLISEQYNINDIKKIRLIEVNIMYCWFDSSKTKSFIKGSI